MAESDMLAAAEVEEIELVRQLEATPIYRKLLIVRQVIAEYRKGSPQREIPGLNGQHDNPQFRVRPLSAIIASRNKINEAANAAEKIIREKGRPVPRGELFDALIANGLVIGGKDPKNTLSARLAHSKRFVKVEDEGYAMPDMVQ